MLKPRLGIKSSTGTRVGLLTLSLLLGSCASWQPPPAFDYSELRQRAVFESAEGVEVRALVLSRSEGDRLFGADVFAHGVEPVWMEISNGTSQRLALLHSGADPDYFSPLEVSWLLHGGILSGGNEQLDQHIESVAFPRGAIPAGERRAGVLFTNPSPDWKVLSIDLLGDNRFISLTVFPPVPDESGNIRKPVSWPYATAEITDIASEEMLDEALDEFFRGLAVDALNQPPTAILVGHRSDVGAALARRGYRWDYRKIGTEQQLLNRPPDFSLRKWSQAGTPGYWLRGWAMPITFQGRRLTVVQAGAPRGGRFTAPSAAADPAVDYIRDLLVQDMVFSDGLAKLAVMRPAAVPEKFADTTDGRVAVLFFSARTFTPGEILITDWDSVDWDNEPPPFGK